MILTEQILNQGKSNNGGWNAKQMECLNSYPLVKGWKRRLIGKDFPEEVINNFISLKNDHIKFVQEEIYLESEVIGILKLYEKTRDVYFDQDSPIEKNIENWFEGYKNK